jgi:hypothetical protein
MVGHAWVIVADSCRHATVQKSVSETVSESTERVKKNSVGLNRILFETPMKSGILTALNQSIQGNPDNWLHLNQAVCPN